MTEEKIVSEKINLENLIAYQEGSVVSKTIIGKKTGTVTLFAFDTGQGLSEHTAPFEALVYVVDGEAKITISGNVQINRKIRSPRSRENENAKCLR